MEMELKSLPPLIALAINALLGCYILAVGRGRAGRFYLAGLAFSVAGWCASAFLVSYIGASEYTYFLREISGIATFCMLAYDCSGRKRPWSQVFSFLLLAAGAGMLALMAMASSPAHLFSTYRLVYYLVAYGLILYLLVRALVFKEEPCFLPVRAIFAIISAPFVAAVVGTVLGLAGLPVPVRFYLSLSLVLSAELIIFQAIGEKKVDLEPLTHQGMVYVIYTLAFAAVIFMVLGPLLRLVGLESIQLGSLLILLIVAVLSAMVFTATRGPLERMARRIISPDKFAYEQETARYQEELRQAGERIRRLERLALVGEVSSTLAHQIKNPLGPIRGYCQMLKDRLERGEIDRDFFRKGLSIIEEESARIDAHVRGLLEFARLPHPGTEEIDLRQVVEKASLLMEGEYGGRFKIVRTFAEPHGTVAGDPDQIQELLVNLIQNAMEAMSENREGQEQMFISVYNADRSGQEYAVVEVADNGPGIGEEIMPKIFEPFFTTKRHGTGLGLAICRAIAEAHGGFIEAGNAERGGAVVKLYIGVRGQ